MTELQAIQAATVNAATMMKHNNIGQIKQGFFADIIAVPANPLKDISVTERVSFVMKSGVIYKQWSGSVLAFKPVDKCRRYYRTETLLNSNSLSVTL